MPEPVPREFGGGCVTVARRRAPSEGDRVRTQSRVTLCIRTSATLRRSLVLAALSVMGEPR